MTLAVTLFAESVSCSVVSPASFVTQAQAAAGLFLTSEGSFEKCIAVDCPKILSRTDDVCCR